MSPTLLSHSACRVSRLPRMGRSGGARLAKGQGRPCTGWCENCVMFAFCSFNAIQTFHAVYDLTFSSSFSSSSSSSKSSSSLILLILLAPVLPLLFPALFPVQSLYGRPKPSCGASCRASFSGSPKRIKWKMCGVSCQCQGNKKFLGLHNLEIVPNCLQARTPGGQCELIGELYRSF